VHDIAALEEWIVGAGGIVAGVAVRRDAGGGRGLFALRDLPAGTTFLSVPRGLLVTRELARGSSVGRQIRDAGLEVTDHTVLAAWLLVEARDPASPFRPYIDALPRDLAGFPVGFGADELQLLAGSVAGELARGRREAVWRDHAVLAARVRLCRFSEDELAWARTCVVSRVYRVTVDGVSTLALVPLADMVNHRTAAEATFSYDDAARAFVVTCAADVAAGAEVHVSYGAKSNARLLAHYGFCVDDNPEREAEVRVGGEAIRIADPTADESRRLIEQHGADEVAAAARAALARFATTLEEDEALLAGGTLARDARNCVLARRDEKWVLRAWLV
jgi:histone-lysine N-methyltransferase SETD3